ncbi:hypothetical protein OUZ56_018900 [Daphnia magna]|uniref:Uncharacterized protein n=1 Tax=Daphnia magna TaxID=35525 RepID=A0ABQ9ZA23_9CRUS|nr:hypothetical protein OUZ56_018900 [Daphnia magna]
MELDRMTDHDAGVVSERHEGDREFYGRRECQYHNIFCVGDRMEQSETLELAPIHWKTKEMKRPEGYMVHEYDSRGYFCRLLPYNVNLHTSDAAGEEQFFQIAFDLPRK